jgi:hypothetical protein
MKNSYIIKWTIALLLICSVWSCASVKSKDNTEQRTAVIAVLNSKDFTVAIKVMEPLTTTAVMNVANELLSNTGNTANRIYINGDGNTLTVRNDSLITRLPYVGERHMGGGYNIGDNGVLINGTVTNYEKLALNKNGETIIKMQAINNAESYSVQLTVMLNGFTRVTINSSQRNSIVYTGDLVLTNKGKYTE